MMPATDSERSLEKSRGVRQRAVTRRRRGTRPPSRSLGSHPAAVWVIKHVMSPVDRFVVKVSGGRLGPPTSLAVPTLLLTTIGRRSGEERTIPLVFVRDEDRYVVGNARPAGERRNPWVFNLRAAGQGVVRVRGRPVPVSARELDGGELERWWPELVDVWPALADHYGDTGERSVFVLDPSTADPDDAETVGRRFVRPPWLVRRAARRELSEAVGRATACEIVARADAAYPGIAQHIPPTRAGARDLLKTSAYTIALHRALVDHGLGSEETNGLVSDVVFASIMPARKMLTRVAGLRFRDPIERARWGSKVTRRLYYTAPDWVIDDVPVEVGFGFDVTRCVIAEFYQSLGMSELCQRAICDQDVRSAAFHGVVLDRSETLSAGDRRCDFRYRQPERNHLR